MPELEGEVELDVQVGAVNNADDESRRVAAQAVHGQGFFGGAFAEAVDAGQVDEIDVAAVGVQGFMHFFDGHADGPVGAGEQVEEGGFAAVGHAQKDGLREVVHAAFRGSGVGCWAQTDPNHPGFVESQGYHGALDGDEEWPPKECLLVQDDVDAAYKTVVCEAVDEILVAVSYFDDAAALSDVHLCQGHFVSAFFRIVTALAAAARAWGVGMAGAVAVPATAVASGGKQSAQKAAEPPVSGVLLHGGKLAQLGAFSKPDEGRYLLAGAIVRWIVRWWTAEGMRRASCSCPFAAPEAEKKISAKKGFSNDGGCAI